MAGYGIQFRTSDYNRLVTVDGSWPSIVTVDRFTIPAGSSGSRSYTQSVASGGIPAGSKNYYAFQNNTPNYGYFSYTPKDRGVSWRWGRTDRARSDVEMAVFSDYSGAPDAGSDYGIDVFGNGLRNTLFANRPMYVLVDKFTKNAGSNVSVFFERPSLKSSTCIVFARDTGGNFLGSGQYLKKNGRLSLVRGRIETPINGSSNRPANSGTLEVCVFDKFIAGTKPPYGIALYDRSGKLTYRNEKTLLLVRGFIKHPYQYVRRTDNPGSSSYTNSVFSIGGGYIPQVDYNNSPMVLVFPLANNQAILGTNSSGYEMQQGVFTGLRFEANRQLKVGLAGYDDWGWEGGSGSSPAWTTTNSANMNLPFIWRTDYF